MNAPPLAAADTALPRLGAAPAAALPDAGASGLARSNGTAPVPAHLASAGWRLEPLGCNDLKHGRDLLLACYPRTPAALWDRGFKRLLEVPTNLPDQPLGVLLQGPRGPAGLALLLASSRPWPGGRQRHVNANSWAIVPAARDRALWMARHGLPELTTTYSALTPIATVAKLLQRLGFEPVTHQEVLANNLRLALLAGRVPQRGATLLAGADALHALRDDPLAAALEDHRRLGCTVLALQPAAESEPRAADTHGLPPGPADTPCDAQHALGLGRQRWVPLVFRPTRRLRCVPTAELVYTPSQALVADHAPRLAAQLLRRGYALMAFDAHQDLVPAFPCTRLFQRRYARCLLNPRGVDHLYSELVYLHS